MKKIAIITGGSHGIGLSLVEKFQAQGFYVVAIARNKTDFSDCFLECDLSLEAQRLELINELRKRFSTGIDVLINNAGIGSYAKNSELSEAQLKRLMEIDFFAPVALANGLLDLLSLKNGSVVNISSVAGLMPVCCMGAYSAAKSALYMFSETFRMENPQIHVMTVCPGRINTGFSLRAINIREVPETPGRSSSSAKRLANLIYKGIKCKKERLIYPAWYRLAIWLSRIFPSLYRYFNRRAWGLK